jgi:hypothetical protein
MDRVEIVSNILNDSKVYDKIAEALGIELNNDSDIFREIEEYVVEQYDEMDNNRKVKTCRACNEEVGDYSYYCSKECCKIDTE